MTAVDRDAAFREAQAMESSHPVTEYGTTRCPNEGWIAAHIDDEDGCCWACGEVVIRPGGGTQ